MIVDIGGATKLLSARQAAFAGAVADNPIPIAITAGATARTAAPNRAEAGLKCFFISKRSEGGSNS